MQKPLVIALLVIHFLGNTEMGQLIKLPSLLRHYHQHCQANHHLSFTTFLSQHYTGNSDGTADDNEEQQMPFHNLHNTAITATIYVFPSFTITTIEKPAIKIQHVAASPVYHAQEFLLKILQPPRFSA
jgi:hypothetical protein